MGFLSDILGGDPTNKKLNECKKKAGEAFTRGNLLIEMEKFDEALDSFDRSSDLWGKICEHFSRHQEESEARQASDNSVEARAAKGNVYFMLGRYDDALTSIDTLLELYPDNALYWANKGVALFNLDRCEEAVKAFDRALDIDPEFADVWCSRGSALSHLEQYEDALESFDKAIENADPIDFNFPRFTWIPRRDNPSMKSDSSRACYFKGVVLSNLGRYDEAVESFDEALEVDPDLEDAKEAREEALSHI